MDRSTTYEISVIKKPVRLPPKTTINTPYIAMHYISQTQELKKERKRHTNSHTY